MGDAIATLSVHLRVECPCHPEQRRRRVVEGPPPSVAIVATTKRGDRGRHQARRLWPPPSVAIVATTKRGDCGHHQARRLWLSLDKLGMTMGNAIAYGRRDRKLHRGMR
jgi:hypothetical protein